MENFSIVNIQRTHNEQLKSVIHTVLKEFNADRPGTAFQDASLNNMYQHYNKGRQTYFVALEQNKVIGGSGIGMLDGEPDGCELQKMYLLKDYRGIGIGEQLMNHCLEYAKKVGYSYCYLETFPSMKKAQQLYRRKGFDYFQKRLGNTCHSACEVFMVKHL